MGQWRGTRGKLVPSVRKTTAAKDHVCIYCGKTIPKGTDYWYKPEQGNRLRILLEKKTGYRIEEIKRRTNLWRVDKYAWKFCSVECLRRWANIPVEGRSKEVVERMNEIQDRIVQEIGDALKMMVKLHGKEDNDEIYNILWKS